MKVKATRIAGLLLSAVMLITTLGAFSLTASAASGLTVTTIEGDSYYEISDASDLLEFAEIVNGTHAAISQNTSANAILSADIVFNPGTFDALGSYTAKNGEAVRAWTPIGNSTNKYSGTFDGNGKTVGGLYFNDSTISCVGLFGYVGEGGTVKNVGVINSYFNAKQEIGGVAGISNGSITACYNTAGINGTSYVGGVVGYNTDTVTSCYYLNTCAPGGINSLDHAGSAEAKTTEQFTSGEVAYLLNGSTSTPAAGKTLVWGQKLGVDPLPVSLTEENKVYYGYTTCDMVQASPIYTNAVAFAAKPAHDFLETAHDGSAQCSACGKLDRHSTGLRPGQSFTDPSNTHVTVSHKAINLAAFRHDSITITFSGDLLSEPVTLGLYNGKLVMPNGSFGAQNTIGYSGGQILGDQLFFRYAFPCANEQHPSGSTTTLQYTIHFADEDGHVQEESDSFTLQYVNYAISTELTEYGTTLNLSFYSTQGTVIRSNVYDAGTYTASIADYYGNVREYEYSVAFSRDPHTQVTREDTPSGTVIRLQRTDATRILVTLPEGAQGAIVEGNGTMRVTVTVTASLQFSYSYMDSEGYESVYFIAVDRPTARGQDFSLDRLGYTTIDFEDEKEYALATDGVTKYRSGSVTVYLIHCIFKATGRMARFTFTPGGATTHTFSKEEIALVENGTEVALTEDVTVSLGAVLLNDHVFLPASCTSAKTCQYCGDTEGEALGHKMADATCVAPKACTVCDHTEGEALGHKMADATCVAPKACTACDHTEGEALGHSYDNACDTTCNSCAEVRTASAHADGDGNSLCDACDAEMPREGLPTGAIVGIAAGGTLAAGIGGFSLFWFVIKKRKWSDLAGIFKKS